MRDRSQVQESDVRALLRLVAEARELLDGGSCPVDYCIRELTRLLRASVACYGELGIHAGVPIRFAAVPIDVGWASQSDRSIIYESLSRNAAESDPMFSAFLRRRSQRPLTLLRGDAVSDRDWSRSAANDEHRLARVGEPLTSLEWLDDGDLARVFVFKRAWGEPAFDSRERDLLNLFHSECGWIFNRPTDLPSWLSGAGLSPRERQTLALLVTGAPEKLIAARLGLSCHTVHDYVKAVYRKAGVTSRVELIARAARSPAALHQAR